MLEEHGNVTLMTDIMYINKIPFIITLSRAILLGTIEMIEDERKSTIIKSLEQVINAYHRRAFKVQHILMDRQFECIRKYMEATGINLNTTAWDEHVPEIERYMCTIKERIRVTTNTLPFEQLPHQLIVEIASNAVFWINWFPYKDGIHNTLSPPHHCHRIKNRLQ